MINWEAAGAIGEILGAAAVVATLLYLARQTRLSREATEVGNLALRSTARIDSTRYWSEETIRMALSPDMASILTQGMEDASVLDDNQRERLIAWYTQHMVAKDGMYHQYLDGILPEDQWHAHNDIVIGMLQYDSFLKVLDAGFLPLTKKFRQHIEAERAAQTTGSWRWDRKARVFDDPKPSESNASNE
jgi:hypothetical protein